MLNFWTFFSLTFWTMAQKGISQGLVLRWEEGDNVMAINKTVIVFGVQFQ